MLAAALVSAALAAAGGPPLLPLRAGRRAVCPPRPLLALRGGSAPAGGVVVRIRTSEGVKKVRLESGSSTLAQLEEALAAQHKLRLDGARQLSRQGEPLDVKASGGSTLAELGIAHGSFLHLSSGRSAAASKAGSAGAEAETAATTSSHTSGGSATASTTTTATTTATATATGASAPGASPRSRAAGRRGSVRRTFEQIDDERRARTLEMKAPPAAAEQSPRPRARVCACVCEPVRADPL